MSAQSNDEGEVFHQVLSNYVRHQNFLHHSLQKDKEVIIPYLSQNYNDLLALHISKRRIMLFITPKVFIYSEKLALVCQGWRAESLGSGGLLTRSLP